MTGILDHLEQGAEVFTRTVALSRDRLVRYAAASGDFNPIHYNDTVATSVGLPGVIAHGMLTMGLAGSVLTDWLESLAPGGAARVRRYGTRFSGRSPCPPRARSNSRSPGPWAPWMRTSTACPACASTCGRRLLA